MRKRKSRIAFILAGVALGLGEGVERHLCRAIADGMKTQLKSGGRALHRHAVQRRLLILRQAGVAGIVGIRRQQRRRARAERAVHEALQHRGVQHGIFGGMMRAVLLQQVERLH